MKRCDYLMRLVVVLIAVACMMSMLTACGGKGDRHECTYGANVTEVVGTSAKCTETKHTCTGCGKTEVVSVTNKHSYSVTDPQVVYKGEEATGYKQTYTCSVCKYSMTKWLSDTEIKDAGLPSIEELNAKHVWTQTESEATKAEYEAYLGHEDTVSVDVGYIATYWKTVRSCSHCNETETVVQRRDVVDPNYTPDSGETGETTPTIPEDNEGNKECEHQYEQKVTAPKCDAKGYTQYTCSKCGKSYTADYTEATGHKMSSWKTTDATCTKAGSKTRSCANCGKVETQTIEAKGHSYGSWSTTKAATCDANGVKTRKCSKCGNAETQTIAATGHAWDEGKVTTTPTSCSDMGVKTYTCTACGRTKTEQIKGNHTFGDWSYEEYTYTQDGVSRVSHRKVRTCTKCGYKENDGTPNHYCARGSDNHVVTTVKAGDCSTKATMRSTCKVCGWYVEYAGSKGKCNWVDKEVHLSDYGPYTNELDATVSECTGCGDRSVVYHKGEGWSDYNRYYVSFGISQGSATNGSSPVTDNFGYYDNPQQQTVKRDFVYDDAGYVKQFTVYWWYNGSRYSQVIKCGQGEIEAWFEEYGLTKGTQFSLKIYGSYIAPYQRGGTS